MVRHRAIKLIKRTEAEELERHRKNRFKCSRCNGVFLTDEELQTHRVTMHGEYQQNDKLRDNRSKKIQPSWRDPPRKEWITKVHKETYMYNPWKKEYFQYKLGVGIITNEFYHNAKDKTYTEQCFCDENSEYFKIWRDIVSKTKGAIPKEPFKSKLTPLKWSKPPSSVKIPRGYIICKVCYHPIRVHKPLKKEDNMLICPCCGWNTLDNTMYLKWLEQQKAKHQEAPIVKPSVGIPLYVKGRKRK